MVGTVCLLLAGCDIGDIFGGGGDGNRAGSEPPSSEPVDPAPPVDSVPGETAAAYAEGAEYRRVEPTDQQRWNQHGWASVCGSDPNCVSAHNYTLQNIHYAHTTTLADGTKLRGKDALVAVVDDGFLLTHQELAGKTVHRYLGPTNSFETADHGTGVASVIAGVADGKGMMGVAPEADLHLTSWEYVNGIDTVSFVRHVTGGTNHAAAMGAVVQNNSWGWVRETSVGEEQANFQASGRSNYASYIASHRGGKAADWQALFDAYDNFQESGVVVYANSNDNTLGDASSWAALPLFVPELSEAWLTVSNALVTLNASDGSIREAQLLSAPCGQAARFCVTSDGVVNTATAQGDASYGVTTGTSFAAPQVSGQIALLAQAFPDLSPTELTARLLATAQTDWAGFQNSIAGEQTFAPGVTRSYSWLYGHGIPDMKAALEPVGELAVPNGGNVATAERTSLDRGIATDGPVVGNAVAKAIADRDVMVVDALGTDFYVQGSSLGTNAASSAPAANAGSLARNVDRVAAAFAFLETEGHAATALHDAAVPKLFFSQTHANLGGDTAYSQVFPLGGKDYLQFSGILQQAEDVDSAAFSISRLTARDGYATELSLSFGHSADGFFGSRTSGPFVAAQYTDSLSAGVSVSKSLSERWSVGAYAEFGSGLVGESPSALVEYGTFAYASGGLTARRRDVVTGRDMLDLYAGVRPAAVAGTADISLPVGRDTDGTIRYDNVAVDLARSDLPMRMGFVYRNRTERDFDLHLGFNTDFLAAGEPEPVYSLSLGLTKEF